jgi:hypothetical protein
VRRFYLSHIRQCRPLWLHPRGEVSFDFSVAELEAVWEMYEAALGRLLNCSIPEDRIRAVYPLFFCVPVDSHEELVSLVNEVADKLTISNSPGAQTAQRHYAEIMGAAVIDDHEGQTQEKSTHGGVVGRVFDNAANAFAFASVRTLTAIQAALPNALDRFRQSNHLHTSARSSPVRGTPPMLEARRASMPIDISEAGEWEMAAITPRSSANSIRAPSRH